MRVIVLAAGAGDRWGNYRGTAKHFLNVEGEVLIERTIRQFSKYTDDILVVGSGQEYSFSNTSLFVPAVTDTDALLGDMLKFYSSMHLWSDVRTVLVFGDVYFTDDAVSQIMSSDLNFTFLLRSNSQGQAGGRREVFALSFKGSMNQVISDNVLKHIKFRSAPRAGGWFLYKSLVRPNYIHNNNHIDIDDWTTDFDYPEDIIVWETKRKENAELEGNK
jgi:hypothetical protein